MPMLKLDTPIQYLKGTGPKLAKVLKKLGIVTVEDLIYFFPRDYEDRSKIKPLSQVQPSPFEVIRGEVVKINHQLTRGRFSVLKLKIADKSGKIQAVWFNQPYLAQMFRPGMKLILTGKVEYSDFDYTMQIIVKDYELDNGEAPKIVPCYPLTEGLYPRKMRSIVKTVLEGCLTQITDLLPEKIREEYELSDLQAAVETLHLPAKLSDIPLARWRLAFDDFFFFQLGLGMQRGQIKEEKGIAYTVDQEKLQAFLKFLPFELTGAQHRVVAEILGDMQSTKPMSRLLQGDVGSGKTIVAAIASLIAINNGYQAVIMAPTEILAQQHFGKISGLFGDLGIRVKLVTGTTQRKKKVENVGDWDLLIGTHALFEAQVQFERLGLVIIDEQHRFGVMQRSKLVSKGVYPDVLIMTATPIPRSLALTLYGDMDRSIIDEMPPGRTPIKTNYVTEAKRKNAYKFIQDRLAEGRQAYVVCPLVEESEKIDLKAALDEAKRLQVEIFPDFKVGLIHGRLKGEEKDQIMKEFKDGEVQVLVSTTVIEVGIDIPNATVMVVEHAERFGLSQLHQLRGRIGRGAEQSYCFLVGKPKTPEARERIKVMVETTDGFKIAEADLKLRGPGEFFGSRQSGLPNFRVGDIIRDEEILREARKAAFDLLKDDPKLETESNQPLRKTILDRYSRFMGY